MVERRGVSHDALAPEPRRRSRLAGLVLTPPIAWSLHLLLCYLAVTLDCTTDWDGSGAAVAILTALFAAASLSAAALAWRTRRSEGDDASEVDAAGAGPSTTFLRTLTIAGGLFFAVTILVTGLAPIFVARCA